MDSVITSQKTKPTKWTKDDVREISLKYKHIVDFKRNDNRAWQWASKKNVGREEFYKEITSHMIPKGTWYKKLVYRYDFPNNVVYFGITNDRDKRKYEHTISGPVFDYVKKTEIKPTYQELTDYIEVKKSKELEIQLINEYRENGWVVLNKTNGGEHGGGLEYLTKEVCQREALKYKHRNEFCESSISHYSKARNKGWLDEICSHMSLKNITWTPELILEYAKNSNVKTITEFSKIYSGAYQRAEELGIREELKEIFEWRGGKKWSKDEIHEIALRYSKRRQFIKENRNAAEYSRRKKWYDEITSHMGYAPGGKRWNKSEVHEKSLKYNTRTEFAKSIDSNFYQSALNNGWLDDVCSHMVSGVNPNKGSDSSSSKLTEKEVLDIRSLYQTGGYSYKKLAEKFGVSSKATIMYIIQRVTWNHI